MEIGIHFCAAGSVVIEISIRPALSHYAEDNVIAEYIEVKDLALVSVSYFNLHLKPTCAGKSAAIYRFNFQLGRVTDKIAACSVATHFSRGNMVGLRVRNYTGDPISKCSGHSGQDNKG